jgi:hypothetical protein
MSKHQVSDLDSWLQSLQKLATMHGPYYAWVAILECINHEKKFPTWIIEYLGRCAERMIDPTDKAKRDPRKKLLEIFEFPPQEKSGPGSPLEPLAARDTQSNAEN